MDRRPSQYTLPLFGDDAGWGSPAPRQAESPKPPRARSPKKGADASPPLPPVAPVEDTPAPPVLETPAPPAIETPAPPPIETPVPPVAETPAAPAIETPAPPMVNTPLPPVAETPVPPVAETPVPPVAETPAPPAIETPTPPMVAAFPAPMRRPSFPIERTGASATRAPRSPDPETPPPMLRRNAPPADHDFPPPRRAPASADPDFSPPRRAPASADPDFSPPRRAPASTDQDFPTLTSRRATPPAESDFAPPRRAPVSTDQDLPTLQSRRAPAPSEMDAPLQRRAPASAEQEMPAGMPRSAPRSGRAQQEEEAPVLSVADLDRRLKRVVEGATEKVRVAGEVSNLKKHASGHSYFTLKDEEEDASIDCVMYRTAPARARMLLEDGARVVLQGRATVFVPRGRLQLIADDAQLEGRGALLEALERLKEKLASEGLFDRERKRPLPRDAKVIGVVTSGDGAAIHDIIKVAFQRGPVRIVLARAPVQGRDAAPKIARALATLSRLRDVEAIIVGRGGGSADDLLAFNEEVIVREAARCRVPVVSAVGHEVDISLLDLVADARAATPSQAAEMLVPDAAARRAELAHVAQRMRRALMLKVDRARSDLTLREGRLDTFQRALAERQQWVDDAMARMEKEMVRRVGQERTSLAQMDRALWSRHPRAVLAAARAAIEPAAQRLAPATSARIVTARREIDVLSSRLARAVERRLDAERGGLSRAAGRLDALSPLAVLSRGYAIATDERGRAVRSVHEVAPGQRLDVRVHDGAIQAQVIATSRRDGDAG